jgi:hypothetical protein
MGTLGVAFTEEPSVPIESLWPEELLAILLAIVAVVTGGVVAGHSSGAPLHKLNDR